MEGGKWGEEEQELRETEVNGEAPLPDNSMKVEKEENNSDIQ
jgi:hypothetical protein